MPFDAKGNMIGDAGGEAMSILNANVAAAIPVSTVVTAPRARQKLSSPGNATMS